jgi:hypothetical protein
MGDGDAAKHEAAARREAMGVVADPRACHAATAAALRSAIVLASAARLEAGVGDRALDLTHVVRKVVPAAETTFSSIMRLP